MTTESRLNTDGVLLAKSASPYFLLNATAWSRIHWRAFSLFPAAIRLEFDEFSLVNEFEPGVPVLLLPLWPSLANECECDDPVRPQRAGFNDEKNDDVFELEPIRERDDDDPEEPAPLLTTTLAVVADEDDGVFRPEEPKN